MFNGEIYNYQELRRHLQASGHRFSTDTDTEVLLHLYQQHRERLVDSLRGMFAFALWDANRKELVLARDRLGIKPLYLHTNEHRCVFASELKALLVVPDIARDIDPNALEDYLTYGVIHGEHGILKGIQRLTAGTVAIVRQRDLTTRSVRYWSLQPAINPRWTDADAIEATRAKIDETVKAHMVADVPVGAFLSGGLDSGIVVATAAHASSSPLQTFSIGFHETEFSEAAEARMTAGRFGTVHHELVATPDSMALVEELTRYFDEPFADASAVPTYLVSQLASRSVKVVLSGDGGDEAFGGYIRYRDDLREWRVRRLLPPIFRQRIVKPLAARWPRTDWLPRTLRARTFLSNVASSGGVAYANSLAICRQPERGRLLSADAQAALGAYRPGRLLAAAYELVGDHDPVAAMIAADIAVQLPDDYLTKVDRASMAHGLEVRPVFVDHELLELTATMPSRLKIRGSSTKWLLRAAYRDVLPPGAVGRAKRGFEVPLDRWFRGPLRSMFHDVVLNGTGPLNALIDLKMARLLMDQHTRGIGRNGATLWAILMLAQWCTTYLPAGRTQQVA